MRLAKIGGIRSSSGLKHKIKDIDPWGIVAFLVLVFCLFCLSYRGYVTRQKNVVSNQITDYNSKLQERQNDLTEVKKHPGYKKYLASKYIYTNEEYINWEENIAYLIQLYDDMRALERENNGITLTNFAVQERSVSVRGQVRDIRTMYSSGGLLDQLVGFDFIEYLDIPYYQKTDDAVGFILDAKIKTYDRPEPTL